MKYDKTRIFIIDDDCSFGSSLQFMLSCRGMSADWFESPHAFLDSVPSGQKGIAIVDINMPILDGFALMDRMKALGYAMPVILITGQPNLDIRDMAMDRGAAGFLQKPFLEKSLLQQIEKIQNR